MAINRFLLEAAKQSIKSAFVPPQPQAGGGAPPMDPSMGGAPPMDPSMMAGGGAPPMDPSMMAAGGAPPMDPSMMAAGGAPPMDPSMGGMPPEAAPAVDPTEQIRSVVQEELQKALASVKGKGGSKKDTSGPNVESYMHRIQKLLTHLYSSLGLNLPHDILDDVPAKSEAPTTLTDASQPKSASFDNIPVSEKAAGILHLLRKIK